MHKPKAEPLLEEGKCGSEFFPIRMFIDCRYKGNDIFPHIHSNIEVICMRQGEMNLMINSQKYHVWEGCVAIINAMEVHMIIGDDGEYYVMQIEPELFDKYEVDIARSLPRQHHVIEPKVHINHSVTRLIEHAFENIGDCKDNERITVLSDIFGMFALIMTYLQQIQDVTELSKTDQKSVERLKIVFAYVEENIIEKSRLMKCQNMCIWQKYTFADSLNSPWA